MLQTPPNDPPSTPAEPPIAANSEPPGLPIPAHNGRHISPTTAHDEPPTLPTPARADLLELPFKQDLRRIFRYESGLLLDKNLARLARLSGAIDRGLALRLLRLRRTLGFRRLGFSCFGDYVRQRVDLSGRTAQEMVRLGRALERLPLLGRALGDGHITWTAAAQLARVANPSNEAEWVRQAEQLSVRELKNRVDEALRERLGAPVSDSHEADGPIAGKSDATAETQKDPKVKAGAATDSQPNPEGDDRCVKLSIQTSPRAARLWAAALELCRLSADAELSEAEACEYLLADFLSGTEPVADDFRAYPLHPPLKYGFPTKRPVDRREKRWCPSEELGDARVDLAALKLSPETLQVFEILDQEPASDPFELDASLHALITARRSLDLDLARLLRIFRWLGLARHIGFPNFSTYVEERLAISVHRATFLARVDRALTCLPATRRAIRCGRIGTVAALLISRVADEDSERAWIERAESVTVVRLRKEVQWAERENAMRDRRMTRPPSPGPLPSELQALTVTLLADAAPAAYPFEGASAWVRQEEVAYGGGAGQGNRSALATCETFARVDDAGEPWPGMMEHDDSAERDMFARGARKRVEIERAAVAQAVRVYRDMFTDDDGRAGRVRVEFWLRKSAVSLWTEARRRMAVAAGVDYVNDPQVLYDVALAFLCTHMRPWLEAVERGDPTAVRDRFVCQIPGCTMRCGAGHHLQFVSQLGPDEPWNLLFVCWVHHLLGIHGGGWLRVSGRAPEELKAELGLRRDGAPLEAWTRSRVAA